MGIQKLAPSDLTRVTLQVLCIVILTIATFWIMRPILPSLIWAAMIVAATWPLMLKVEKLLWGKRFLATTVMTIIMLLLFIVPFSLAIAAIFENVDRVTAWLNSVATGGLPALPSWINSIPIIGPKLANSWQSAVAGTEGLSERLTPYAGKTLRWFLSQAGSIGVITIQFLLTVIISAIFYSKGEVVSTGILRFANRLAGTYGQEVAILAAKTVRGVAVGVVGTALIQSFLGGIGLAVSGIPAASVLTAIMFMLCIAQIGPGLVLIPSIIWLYYNNQPTWGTALLVWSIFVGTFDNFLRPFLIRMGADIPLFLIFAGVIGGLITFGIVGLFIGPIVLAITYRLLTVWLDSSEIDAEVKEN
jgi:predicted PurR-regulated permease PerM